MLMESLDIVVDEPSAHPIARGRIRRAGPEGK